MAERLVQKVRGERDSTMFVVAYDIPDDKRRTRVHKLLKGFGNWTEYSLFECWLTKKEMLQLREKLDRHLNGERDRVRIYSVCANCVAKVETVGLAAPLEETSYLV